MLTGGGTEREDEERAALAAFCPGAELASPCSSCPTAGCPRTGTRPRARWRSCAALGEPDLVLAPTAHDAHQDHRALAELVPTVFRDHLALGYEILKWDGDLGRPPSTCRCDAGDAEEKVDLLHEHYPSQRDRAWWDREVFLGLARLRGMECHARYAEAFHAVKMCSVARSLDPTD